jgi:AraC-like DNA-binding protein
LQVFTIQPIGNTISLHFAHNFVYLAQNYCKPMPLYMDIHTIGAEPFSVQDVATAHMEDLAIQEKFGVTQIKYWVNEEAQTIFCLMKGPNKEACHLVHQESHGNTACNIIEVSDNEYNLFMGVGTDNHDLAQTETGVLDTGYRTLLLAKFVSLTSTAIDKKDVYRIIEENNGTVILSPSNELMVSFIYASDAIKCAINMRLLLNQPNNHIVFSMAISSGEPVDEHGDQMFEKTQSRVSALVSLGFNSSIYLDKESLALSDKEQHLGKLITQDFILVDQKDIQLGVELHLILSSNQTNSTFTSAHLDKNLGLSKSQAYRKIKALTGVSQNKLIQNCRLQKSLTLLDNGIKTIAEVAYESGFNSPSYFTRSFKKQFGVSPINIVKNVLK